MLSPGTSSSAASPTRKVLTVRIAIAVLAASFRPDLRVGKSTNNLEAGGQPASRPKMVCGMGQANNGTLRQLDQHDRHREILRTCCWGPHMWLMLYEGFFCHVLLLCVSRPRAVLVYLPDAFLLG